MPAQNTDSVTGRTYGDWTVIAFSHKDREGHWWRVRCACGAERTQRSWVLTSGKSTCCGACSARKASRLQLQRQADMWVGTKGNGWIIVAHVGTIETPSGKITMWACRCLTCGAVVDMPRSVIHKPTMPICRHGVSPVAAH